MHQNFWGGKATRLCAIVVIRGDSRGGKCPPLNETLFFIPSTCSCVVHATRINGSGLKIKLGLRYQLA